jgi:hypothetical protein
MLNKTHTVSSANANQDFHIFGTRLPDPIKPIAGFRSALSTLNRSTKLDALFPATACIY